MSDITRRLATIRRITSLEPIIFENKETGEQETANAIQLATVDGWHCVVKTSEFSKPGELCVYFEIDSMIPRQPWNLHINADKVNKPIRLKTVKLKGYLSQGLALPLNLVFADVEPYKDTGDMLVYSGDNDWAISEGSDVTELLGVTKYEPEENLSGEAKGSRPGFVPKTDQHRIQNIPKILDLGLHYEVTEKLEGTSISVYCKDGQIGITSRNMDLKEGDNKYWSTLRKYEHFLTVFEHICDTYVIQGELVGPGIQNNIYGLKENEIYVYDIYDYKRGEYLPPQERRDTVEFLGLHHVPVVSQNLLIDEKWSVDDVLLTADGQSLLGNTIREGLVFKSLDGKASWKAVSNDYLLKKGKKGS